MLTLFLSGTHPEAELLYHVVVLVLIFFKKCVFWLCWVFTVALRLSVVVHGLSGPEACGILIPDQDREHIACIGSGFSATGPPGKALVFISEKPSHCFPNLKPPKL